MSFDQPFLVYLIAAVAGYALGSIPFGLILTKLAGKGDVRAIGSGNIGATNVLRTGSKALAAGTLVCDMLDCRDASVNALGRFCRENVVRAAEPPGR